MHFKYNMHGVVSKWGNPSKWCFPFGFPFRPTRQGFGVYIYIYIYIPPPEMLRSWARTEVGQTAQKLISTLDRRSFLNEESPRKATLSMQSALWQLQLKKFSGQGGCSKCALASSMCLQQLFCLVFFMSVWQGMSANQIGGKDLFPTCT